MRTLPKSASRWAPKTAYLHHEGWHGRCKDTRTLAQKVTMEELLQSLCVDYPDAEILGHRDLPGVHKECPCFDTRAWLKEINFHI